MSKRKTSNASPEGRMPLSGHLRELRNRILVCIAFLLAAVLLGLRFAPEIVERLLSIGREYGYSYVPPYY